MTSKPSRELVVRQTVLRTQIADMAARLIIEQGVQDYAQAKRKAARKLGVQDSGGLPSNEEVNQAVMARQSLYEPEEQAVLLQALREEAWQVMQIFASFQPVLTGAVASGAVSEHTQIDLDLLVESSKDFEQFLLNRKIEFKVQDKAGRAAYLIYAEPADVMVHLPLLDGRNTLPAHRHQLTFKQLERLMQTQD